MRSALAIATILVLAPAVHAADDCLTIADFATDRIGAFPAA